MSHRTSAFLLFLDQIFCAFLDREFQFIRHCFGSFLILLKLKILILWKQSILALDDVPQWRDYFGKHWLYILRQRRLFHEDALVVWMIQGLEIKRIF